MNNNDNRSNRPFRRHWQRVRDFVQVEQRDPLSEVGLAAKPHGPGIIDSPMNVPDLKDVPVPQPMDAPNSRLPQIVEARPFQAEHRDDSGNRYVNARAGRRYTPGEWPSVTIANGEVILGCKFIAGHYKIQNNSGLVVYYEIDGPATPGSINLSPGQFIADDVEFRQIHIYTTVATNINGNVSGSIYVAVYQ